MAGRSAPTKSGEVFAVAMVVVMYEPGLERLDRDIAQVVRRITDEVGDDATRYAPVDTWEMVNTIRRSYGHSYRGRYGHAGRVWVGRGEIGGYWPTVEYGSRAHVIRPRVKRALYWPGALHPVGKVNHPGTPAQPFMRRALYQQRALGLAGRA